MPSLVPDIPDSFVLAQSTLRSAPKRVWLVDEIHVGFRPHDAQGRPSRGLRAIDRTRFLNGRVESPQPPFPSMRQGQAKLAERGEPHSSSYPGR